MSSALEPVPMRGRRNRTGVISHRAGKPVRAVWQVGRLLLIAVAVLVASTVIVTGTVVASATSRIKPGIALLQANGQAAPIPQVGALSGGANILLVGTDTRTGLGGAFATKDQLSGSSGAGSNDVNLLLHISADHTSATVISIPRDLEVPIPACPDPSGGTFSPQSKAMFNTTLSLGGLSCVVLTAQQLTGLTIPYAAIINFNGVMAMADAVGGVTVCLNAPIVDPSAALNLPAGLQKLTGANALGFVRTRYGVGDGSDLGRISNQQVFLSALARQIMSEGVLSNPIVLYQLANAAASNIQASASLANPSTMVSIALALKNISLANIVFLQYPAVGDPANPNRVIPDSSAAAALIAALQADTPMKLTGTLGRGAVVNPSPTADVQSSGTPTIPQPSSTPSVVDMLRVPTATPTAAAPVAAAPAALPSNITGQTAAQATCSKAN